MRSREVFWQKNQLWEDMIDACRQEGMVSVKIDEVEGGGSQEGSILCCMNILRHDMMDVPSNIEVMQSVLSPEERIVAMAWKTKQGHGRPHNVFTSSMLLTTSL
ncbi:hypothetical protein V6N11_070072 [Hibiscus sabdariffa]|uniref:Uncharacterized protein n=1 Tax=Hibiscus sabdariffa TaxID=183260 RepID=A0ABR2QDZ2_9ROSI